jgi:hypothetical protein
MKRTKRKSRLVLLGLILALPFVVDPQAQSIISPERRIDWSQAGIPDGIPTRPPCATLDPSATALDINNAIAGCGGGVVYLNAGTYNLLTGITFGGRDNVTLRGAGPDRTVLKFTAPNACGGVQANICVQGAPTGSSPPPGSVRQWTAGFSKGTNRIRLNSTTDLTAGMVLVLDQLDDPADTGGVFISCSRVASLETCPTTRLGRSQQQIVRVTAIDGDEVTIFPGLHMPNWRGAQQPQVWWWGDSAEMNGIEDLTLDHTSGLETAGIGFRNAYGGWVRNVKSLNANRNHVWLYRSARIEVRNSYFYGTKNAATQSYGVEAYMTSDDLVVNNIFQRVTTPIMTGPSAGCVFGYNFMSDMSYAIPTWMMAGINGSHDAGTGMNLFEGNAGNSFLMDLYHGTGALATLFRNRLIGTEPGKTQGNTSVVSIWGYNRSVNIVANVLGTPDYHRVYENSQTASGTPGSPDRSIYLLGYTGVEQRTPLGYDPLVVTTMLRWGNFDYATKATRWTSAEVPAGHPAPATDLPPSLFLFARPSWWGARPWPAIGPDVTGGADASGHAHKIPAQECFDNSARGPDGAIVFRPDECYGREADRPRPPTNLRIVRTG